MSFLGMVIADRIIPKIVKRKRGLKRSISMMILAIGIAFIVSDSVTNTFDKRLTEQNFYIELALLVGYLLYSGLENRKEIPKKMQFSYYYNLGCFTSVFITLGVMMYWILPFSKFVS
jgi:predicted tellurium resistance membrane protein TerC